MIEIRSHDLLTCLGHLDIAVALFCARREDGGPWEHVTAYRGVETVFFKRAMERAEVWVPADIEAVIRLPNFHPTELTRRRFPRYFGPFPVRAALQEVVGASAEWGALQDDGIDDEGDNVWTNEPRSDA